MKVSEKKLGCLQGIVRENLGGPCGYIDGSIAELKSGMREVSIVKDEVILWIVNSCDIIVDAGDIASAAVVSASDFIRKGRAKVQGQDVKSLQYGIHYLLDFTDGRSGVLKVLALNVSEKTFKDPKAAAQSTRQYVAVVKGWLTPDGKKDEKYDSALCPEGYKPEIVGFKALFNTYKADRLVSKLGLSAEALNATVFYNGMMVPFIKGNG